MSDISSDDYKKARDIFFQYDGSLFFMTRDGVDALYKSYAVDAKTEGVWREDIVQQRMIQYQATSLYTYLNTLKYYQRYELLEEIAKVELQGDLLNRLVNTELLLEFLRDGSEIVTDDIAQKCMDKIRWELIYMDSQIIPAECDNCNIEERLSKIRSNVVS